MKAFSKWIVKAHPKKIDGNSKEVSVVILVEIHRATEENFLLKLVKKKLSKTFFKKLWKVQRNV